MKRKLKALNNIVNELFNENQLSLNGYAKIKEILVQIQIKWLNKKKQKGIKKERFIEVKDCEGSLILMKVSAITCIAKVKENQYAIQIGNCSQLLYLSENQEVLENLIADLKP